MTSLPITRSLNELIREEDYLGSIFNLNYEEALVVTTDFRQEVTGGIPKNAFLTAAALDADGAVAEVILLSVINPEPMNISRELVSVREELATSQAISGDFQKLDPQTESRLSTIGFRCKVLGTFYKNAEGAVRFGADLARIRGNSLLKVYRPRGRALSLIGSFSGASGLDSAGFLEIGKIRYAETQQAVDHEAAAFINIRDFIGKKTALLGMTRTGKALERNAKIPVPVSAKFPSGWAFNYQLSVGDEVLSSCWLPAKITDFTPWKKEPVYAVKFEDGQTVKTAGSHIWLVNDLSENEVYALSLEMNAPKNPNLKELSAIASSFDSTTYASLAVIAEILNADPMWLSALAREVGVETNLAADLPASNEYEATSTDDPVRLYPIAELTTFAVERLSKLEASAGSPLIKRLVTTEELYSNLLIANKEPRWAVELFTPVQHDEHSALSIDPYALGYKLGSLKHKKLSEEPSVSLIPAVYLRANFSQRLALLQGFMDSAGVVNDEGALSFKHSNGTLIESVLELIRSLGVFATLEQEAAEESYSVVFFTELPVFRIKEKIEFFDRRVLSRLSKMKRNKIVAIELLDEDGTRCLTVDAPDSLHLVEGFIPTHNSNSTKTILQKVHQYSRNSGEKVAQLIFDPQGEYAQANSQDGSAIADIGDEDEISIYKIMDTTANPKERFLQFDLFKTENLALTWELILAELSAGISREANYIAPLFNLDFHPLGENASPQERHRFDRKKLGLYALMYEGIKTYPVPGFTVSVGEELAVEIAAGGDGVTITEYDKGKIYVTSTLGASKAVAALLRDKASSSERLRDSWVREIEDGEAGKLFEQIVNIREKGRNGVKASISRIQDLHSSLAEGDVRDNVWQDIKLGKLIIVDLSRGSTKTSQVLSELIVNYLLDQASELFISGKNPVPFQIVVEEAHNLFERDSRKDDRDPWVRISKEASKYKIGLLYATQEVTSVDRRILSNTSNWIISNLNSLTETNELSKYYQFADWAEHIRKIETKGFARVKTESSSYIIPVQIELFRAAPPSVKQKTNKAPIEEAEEVFEF